MFSVSAAFLFLSSLQAAPGAALADQARELEGILEPYIARAQAQPASTADPAGPEDPLMSGLSEFSRLAMRLSLQMEHQNGPEDLRCIYRGMAQDALDQRHELESVAYRADQLRVYAEIRYLLGHAREISPIADQDDIEPFTGVAPECPRGPLG